MAKRKYLGTRAPAYSWKQKDQGRQTTVEILETLLQLCCRSSAVASRHDLDASESASTSQQHYHLNKIYWAFSKAHQILRKELSISYCQISILCFSHYPHSLNILTTKYVRMFSWKYYVKYIILLKE